MKRNLIIAAVCLFAFQLSAISQETKKNIFSVSSGIWGRGVVRASDNSNLTVGPTAALSYQRAFSPYISFTGKFFGGMLNHREVKEFISYYGVSAGVIVTPFGNLFPNLKIGFSPMYILELVQNQVGSQRSANTTSWIGFEIPLKFYIVDKEKWQLGVGVDFQFGENLGRYPFCNFTISPVLTYGIKF